MKLHSSFFNFRISLNKPGAEFQINSKPFGILNDLLSLWSYSSIAYCQALAKNCYQNDMLDLILQDIFPTKRNYCCTMHKLYFMQIHKHTHTHKHQQKHTHTNTNKHTHKHATNHRRVKINIICQWFLIVDANIWVLKLKRMDSSILRKV